MIQYLSFQKPRKRLSDTFRNSYRNDYDDELSYPRRNRKSGYPLALGLSSTASTTTRRPFEDLNEISSQGKNPYHFFCYDLPYSLG